MKLIVSIISDQTIPNIQIIKEFSEEDTRYLFVTSTRLDPLKWILSTCNICASSCEKYITKDEYDIDGFKNSLAEVDYSKYDEIIVNVTGGTKVMSMAVSEFFTGKDKVRILYVQPYRKGKSVPSYMEMYPEKKEVAFTSKISIDEYLKGYGFKVKDGKLSKIAPEYTSGLFSYFVDNGMEEYYSVISIFRSRRNKTLLFGEDLSVDQKVKHFLSSINFSPESDVKLSKEEIEYLSGGWFEEYIYYRVKKELYLADDSIKIGTHIEKDKIKSNEDLYKLYLGTTDLKEGKAENEFDVMFIVDNILYVIECKSSVISESHSKVRAIDKNKQNKKSCKIIISETIYKLDSLCSKLGIFPQKFIATMSDFSKLIDLQDVNDRKSRISVLKDNIDRAQNSKIRFIDQRALKEKDFFYNIDSYYVSKPIESSI